MAAEMTYGAEADALRVSFTPGPTVEEEEVHPGVILHFDAAGRIVAVELLHPSKVLCRRRDHPVAASGRVGSGDVGPL
jgi:uncharacterized protein YuzE